MPEAYDYRLLPHARILKAKVYVWGPGFAGERVVIVGVAAGVVDFAKEEFIFRRAHHA